MGFVIFFTCVVAVVVVVGLDDLATASGWQRATLNQQKFNVETKRQKKKNRTNSIIINYNSINHLMIQL